MTTTSATGNDRRARAGFTLLELSIVITILAVVLALAAPSFLRTYREMLLTDAGRTFATSCQLARLNAVVQQRNVTLLLDLSRQSYTFTQSRTNGVESAEPVTLKTVTMNPRIILLSVTLADDLSGARADAGQHTAAINFYPNGTCDGATVAFRGRENKVVMTMALDAVSARALPVGGNE